MPSSWKNFTFQQDSAPSHRLKQAVVFMQTNVTNFIEPQNNLLN